MAPNAEEELLVVKPWGPQPEKERLRPPTYNAEDYAIALRRWGRRSLGTVRDSQGTLPSSTTSSSSGYASGSGEMTLRQFTSVSELLNKLRADLRLAFPSFVQEFASPPADGITLLLETLRGVQLAQNTPPATGQMGPRLGTRRAALDELGCVECLAACGERCADAPRLLVQAQPGLLALAVCLTSSLNRSRVLALQLLTKVCGAPGGHAAVSEAVSTLRLKYGEGGRFRFLAGALLAPRAAIALRVAGVSFLNAFLRSAPRTQTKLYIQAEACEAGLEPQVLREWLREPDDLLRKEVDRWTRNCVDVDALQHRVTRAEETCRILSKRISLLQMQLEKQNEYDSQERDKRTSTSLIATKKVSSNAEDEGISSSERSSSPEDTEKERTTIVVSGQNMSNAARSNDRETTIDDVIEELRIIVKDAEEEYRDESGQSKSKHGEMMGGEQKSNSQIIPNKSENDSYEPKENRRVDSKIRSPSQDRTLGERVTYFGNAAATNRQSPDATRKLSKSSMEGSVKIVVKGPDVEEAIVPAILHPQPPRRTPACLSIIMATGHCDFTDDRAETYNFRDEEIEEETLGDGSDSLLSASRLKYNGKHEAYEERTRTADVAFVDSNGWNVKTVQEKDAKNGADFVTADVKPIDESKGSSPGQFNEHRHVAIQRHGSRYRSEVEKRKQLRRSASHDYLESDVSSPRSKRSTGRVECRVRKFESLNSFDERASLQNYGGKDCSHNGHKREETLFSSDTYKYKMRRSESFHHVSYAWKKERCSSKGGDSDSSGLLYVTDFNLEPLVARRPRSIDAPKSPSLLTKSLDRIDEGLDSMVDIVITQEQNQWNADGKRRSKANKSRDEKQLARSKSIRHEAFYNDSSKLDQRIRQNGERDSVYKTKHSRNDEFYRMDKKQLKNDEFYEERKTREWNYYNESNYTKSKNAVSSEASPVILSKSDAKRNSFSQKDKLANRLSNESGIFVGRTYDTFGLGKSRFNAAKYSGGRQIKESTLGRRNTSSSMGKRGKVTDVVSGLY